MRGEQLQQFIYNRLIFVELLSAVCACILVYIIYKLMNRRLGFSNTKNVIVQYNTAKESEKLKIQATIKFKQITNIIKRIKKKIGFDFSSYEEREQIEYLLKRNNIGGLEQDSVRTMDFYEYDAVLTIASIVVVVIGLLVCLINITFGILFIIIGLAIVNNVPTFLLKEKIKLETQAIKEEFGDYFMNQYYLLVDGAANPIKNGFMLYRKITQKKEMQDFLTSGLDLIEIYGEMEAIDKIQQIYKDIPTLNRLLRITKQMMTPTGGESGRKDLEGVKLQVEEEKRAYMQQRLNALKAQAHIAIMIVFYILLAQGVAGLLTIFMVGYKI